MNRFEIIKQLKKYFQVYELVGPKTYKKFGEDSWQFFDTDALHCLLIIRKGINDRCTINNWYWGGKIKQRGLRTNVQSIFRGFFLRLKLYLSGHVLGKAFDLVFENTSAEDVRKWIVDNQDLFPCKIRLEHKKNGVPITWTHMDTKQTEKNPKVYLFNV